jgi:hypothetical protein
MEILNKESLDAAVKKCKDNDHYKVIAVTEYAGSHKDIVDYLRQFGCNGPGVRNNPYVYFENGSVIRMLSLVSTPRGYKANLVLCVPRIFYDENSYKFRAMEVNNHKFQGKRAELGVYDDVCGFTPEERETYHNILVNRSFDTGSNIFEDKFWIEGDDAVECVVPSPKLLHDKATSELHKQIVDNLIKELNKVND